MTGIMALIVLAVGLTLAWLRASILSWLLAGVVLTFLIASESRISAEALQIIYLVFGLTAALLGIPPLRKKLISAPLLHGFQRRLFPLWQSARRLDETRHWAGEPFSDHPNWEHSTFDGQTDAPDFLAAVLHGHPYWQRELAALQQPTPGLQLDAFDAALLSHLSFILSNATRSCLLGLSNGWGMAAPKRAAMPQPYRQLNRLSAAVSLLGDVLPLYFGERLCAQSPQFDRLLPPFQQAVAALRELPHTAAAETRALDIRIHAALYEIEQGLDAVLHTLPRWLRWPLWLLIFPLGWRLMAPPAS